MLLVVLAAGGAAPVRWLVSVEGSVDAAGVALEPAGGGLPPLPLDMLK